MKSKKIICGALAATMVLGVAFSGCGLISTDNAADMKQTIATVNITKSENLGEGLNEYASVISDKPIVKRELLNAFVNNGSQYVSSLGYEGTFNMLLEQIANNAILVQYSTLYVLKSKSEDGSSGITLAEYKAKPSEKDKLIYLLGGEKSHGVLQAQYNLYSSLNSALDSFEETKDEDDDKYVGTETRSTPDGVDTTVEDYLPLTKDEELDYGVYTGYDNYLLSDAGKYEPKDKSNRNTRRKAYSRFLKSIGNNYLLTPEDNDSTDILSLSYVQNQYVSQLEQSVIEEFNDIYTKEQQAKVETVEDGEYSFVKKQYDRLLGEQEQTNSKSSTFESTMGSMSDTSFILYAPTTKLGDDDDSKATFGYVYNILLPFSEPQSNRLNLLQSYRTDGILDESGYFAARNELMKDIVTTDQRAAWFNGTKDYSFNAVEYNKENFNDGALDFFNGGVMDRSYLFFEYNLTKTSEYEALKKYIGLYSYNGMVTTNKDGSYTLIPEKLTIDDMLHEFSDYINFVLGTSDSVEVHAGDTLTGGTSKSAYAKYYETTNFMFDDEDKKDEIDYSKLVYATGKVDLKDMSKENMFLSSSDRYKAMAAVNELQYAYTTDTGVLSQYIGYSVNAYTTSYIKEFEYAAQEAIKMGVGAFKVCAGDYGWHLIYVTDAFDFEGGAVYGNVSFTEERVKTKGTFEYMFFEWIKDQTLANEITQKRTEILQYLSNEKTITKFEKAYKDLLELG